MPAFQVYSQTAPTSAPPRKQPGRLSSEWALFMRILGAISIAVPLFITILSISHNNLAFILLPVLLSLFITSSRRYSFSGLLHGRPAYLLLILALAVVYYGGITAFELLTHPASVPIVLITTSLTWTVLLDPLRASAQALIERRYNVRNRQAREAIEVFTSTLRQEIDQKQLCERLLSVIQQTLEPYSTALWLRASAKELAQSLPNALHTIADDDPILAYALQHSSVLDLGRLPLTSAFVKDQLARHGELLLPLSSSGELIGLLILGPRLNGEDYAREDRVLLANLAPQVAPALRVAQLVQERQEQAREQERIEQELRTAREIQLTFLPKEVPTLADWQLIPYYKPAREVGGDFYDLLLLEDGRLALTVGDVTGKGIPAALLMTATRTMLRTAVQQQPFPAKVLARTNALLQADIPPGIFVTCFYAILDPHSGLLHYANAGHETPYYRHNGAIAELRATGTPLGMLPGTCYDEYTTTLAPGESLLFYSDGLVEAHNPSAEMFDLPRLQAALEGHPDCGTLIPFLMDELTRFTGPAWEQEDDVTLLLLHRQQALLPLREE